MAIMYNSSKRNKRGDSPRLFLRKLPVAFKEFVDIVADA